MKRRLTWICSGVICALIITGCANSNQISENMEGTSSKMSVSSDVSSDDSPWKKTSVTSTIATEVTGESTKETAKETTEETAKETTVADTKITWLPTVKEQVMDYSVVNEQYAAKKKAKTSFYKKISAKKDYPCINITTQDEKKISSKSDYVTSVIDVVNCNKSYKLSANAGVKVRGNSTAEQGDEKPYRIKFEKKHNMLGLHNGNEYKSWVLLRSYWNFATDYMAFHLAKTIFKGEYYSSDCAYVNLYINNEFRGVYLLCEQNQVGKGRFEVNEPNEGDSSLNTGYLLEMNNYPDGDDHPNISVDSEGLEITDINGVTRKIESKDYSVKSNVYTQEQLDFIKKYLNGAFAILHEAAANGKPMMFDEDYNVVSADGVYDTAYEALNAIFDLKSLANMLILEELVHNYDVGAGSFYIAIDFSEKSNYKKITFCGPWDFNWSYEGNSSGSYYAATFQNLLNCGDNSNTWFIMAMDIPEFQEMVKKRWNEISKKSLVQVTNQVEDDIALWSGDLGSSLNWEIKCAGDIVKFVRGRITWLDTQWKIKK